jgi:uncharacterized membrane protein
MDFKNALFTMPLLVGIIFMIAAFIMLKFPPKKINMLYGYRTASSMKNQEQWDFAQRYSSKLMIYCGFGLTLSSILGLIIKVSEGTGVFISTTMMIITILILLYKTEKAIKNKFNHEK